MRRLLVPVLILTLIPATSAAAADLGDLLDRSGQASYSAQQVISCSTPDGVRDAVIDIAQDRGEVQVSAPVDSDVEVASGFGGWSLVRGGSVISSASVTGTDKQPDPRYTLDEGADTKVLGRDATLYHMVDNGVVRAELVFDDELGILVRATTFEDDGSVYCERRFIDFDAGAPTLQRSSVVADAESEPTPVETSLPDVLSGFQLLDVYQDQAGFVFGYYSDGFFSFAVFQTPTRVALGDPVPVSIDDRSYVREFSPGQVSYSWETTGGGLALVGDLPPDMHAAVLDALPAPADPGLLRRVWRSLFG